MPQRRPVDDRHQRGISIIEIMVAIAIVAILFGTAVPSFEQSTLRRRLEGRTAELVADLAFAKSEAISRNSRVVVSFLTDSHGGCYVLHTGANAGCVCAMNKPTQCKNGAIEIKTALFPSAQPITLQTPTAATVHIGFMPRGTASPASITLSTANHLALKANVSLAGLVQLCYSDTNALTGYKPCK